MPGHGEKLTRLQWRAIGELLARSTQLHAADNLGVNERTLRRWLSQPEFRIALQKAQKRLFEDAIGELRVLSHDATTTLQRAMRGKAGSLEVRAAVAVLTQGFKATETLEIVERIERLEKMFRRGEESLT